MPVSDVKIDLPYPFKPEYWDFKSVEVFHDLSNDRRIVLSLFDFLDSSNYIVKFTQFPSTNSKKWRWVSNLQFHRPPQDGEWHVENHLKSLKNKILNSGKSSSFMHDISSSDYDSAVKDYNREQSTSFILCLSSNYQPCMLLNYDEEAEDAKKAIRIATIGRFESLKPIMIEKTKTTISETHAAFDAILLDNEGYEGVLEAGRTYNVIDATDDIFEVSDGVKTYRLFKERFQ